MFAGIIDISPCNFFFHSEVIQINQKSNTYARNVVKYRKFIHRATARCSLLKTTGRLRVVKGTTHGFNRQIDSKGRRI
jgi:hypothetical protein